VLATVNMPPWRIFLWVKFIELVLQARPKALWRAYFQSDRAARHGMNWFTRMGRRVLLHEWWNFFFCDREAYLKGNRRVKDGPTLEQFWGMPQDHQEIPLRIKSQVNQN
jgi:anaerobic magnesium-protoporphyrin IX monomethyl ester cyclase